MKIKYSFWIINVLLAGLSVLFTSCDKYDFPQEMPVCMQKVAKELVKHSKKQQIYVSKGQFNGRMVYTVTVVVNATGRDVGYSVYDSDCNNICSLGGFGGNLTECEGISFPDNFEDGEVIWKSDE
jgi:maltodextrin utilization protein YvdJ